MTDAHSDAMSKIFPIKEGDRFMLGPYYFECIGWENGRIKANRFERRNGVLGYITYSLLPELMVDPGFKMLKPWPYSWKPQVPTP